MGEDIDTAPFITTHLHIGFDGNILIIKMDFVHSQYGTVVILDDRFICYDYETVNQIIDVCFDNPELNNSQNTITKRNIFQMHETKLMIDSLGD